MKFSEKLQKLRKDNNLSQEQLADKLDVSRQSVSKWESGQTYPEMDKLLTMCKIFNITLDDLTNDEIKYNEVKTKNTNAFSNLIDDLMYIIDKSFSMFKNMSSKTRGKIIGELIILFLILFLFRIPFSYIENLGYSLSYNLPRGGQVFASLWSFIINTVYLILFIFTYLYIYKTHYLDKYKETQTNKNETSNEIKEEEKNEIKENSEPNKNTKKEYKEPSHFGGTLFTALGKVSTFCIKGFLAFMCIPFIITLITLFLCGTIMFGLLFKGIVYFGMILLLIAGSILNIILIKAMLSFIFNLKVNARILLILFLTGLGLIGIGTGITVIEFASTEFIDEAPKSKYELTTKNYEYEISDNLIIQSYHNITETKVDESLTDKVKLEITYYDDLMRVQPFENNIYDFNSIEIWANAKWNKNIFKIFTDNLKEKKIYNYNDLFEYKVTVYTSSANIEKLKNNYDNFEKAKNEAYKHYYNNEINDLNIDINNLNNQIYNLENKIEELNDINENLQNENIELKDKIQEYKNNLHNLLD